jgi:hypothetical protein
MAALLFVAAALVKVLVATSDDVAEELKADDDDDDVEYAILFLPDDFNTIEKQSPMATRLSNRMRVLDRFIVDR